MKNYRNNQMKKKIYFLFITLILGVNISCEKDSSYDYLYANDYIRDKIKIEISKGIIGNKHLFVVNEKTLNESEIEGKLTGIKEEDIISISFIDKNTAKDHYPIGEDGVVKINYYIDYLLKPNYYNFDHIIIDILNDLIEQNKVVRYPLIVLNGNPLRGTEIKTNIDGIESGDIKEILVLDLSVGLSVYGERAINGVVLISTLTTN